MGPLQQLEAKFGLELSKQKQKNSFKKDKFSFELIEKKFGKKLGTA